MQVKTWKEMKPTLQLSSLVSHSCLAHGYLEPSSLLNLIGAQVTQLVKGLARSRNNFFLLKHFIILKAIIDQ